MKINKKFKIWEVAEKSDTLRPAMEYICFRNGYAYATDAHILIRVPIEELFEEEALHINAEELKEQLNGVLFHAALWKKVAAFEGLRIEVENDIPVFKTKINKHEIIFRFVKDGSPFKYPKAEELFKAEPKEPVSRIAFPSVLLAKLAAAMGENDIILNFASEKDKILISPLFKGRTNASGVIMPKMIRD